MNNYASQLLFLSVLLFVTAQATQASLPSHHQHPSVFHRLLPNQQQYIHRHHQNYFSEDIIQALSHEKALKEATTNKRTATYVLNHFANNPLCWPSLFKNEKWLDWLTEKKGYHFFMQPKKQGFVPYKFLGKKCKVVFSQDEEDIFYSHSDLFAENTYLFNTCSKQNKLIGKGHPIVVFPKNKIMTYDPLTKKVLTYDINKGSKKSEGSSRPPQICANGKVCVIFQNQKSELVNIKASTVYYNNLLAIYKKEYQQNNQIYSSCFSSTGDYFATMITTPDNHHLCKIYDLHQSSKAIKIFYHITLTNQNIWSKVDNYLKIRRANHQHDVYSIDQLDQPFLRLEYNERYCLSPDNYYYTKITTTPEGHRNYHFYRKGDATTAIMKLEAYESIFFSHAGHYLAACKLTNNDKKYLQLYKMEEKKPWLIRTIRGDFQHFSSDEQFLVTVNWEAKAMIYRLIPPIIPLCHELDPDIGVSFSPKSQYFVSMIPHQGTLLYCHNRMQKNPSGVPYFNPTKRYQVITYWFRKIFKKGQKNVLYGYKGNSIMIPKELISLIGDSYLAYSLVELSNLVARTKSNKKKLLSH